MKPIKRGNNSAVLWQSICLLLNLAASEDREYVKLPISLEGCGEMAVNESAISCAAHCQFNCSAFQFLKNTKKCVLCDRFNLRGLAGNSKGFYVVRTSTFWDIPLTNADYDLTKSKHDFKQPVGPGLIIYFSFTFLRRQIVAASLNNRAGDPVLQLGFTAYFGGVFDTVTLSRYVNGTWTPEDGIPKYPMVAGQRLEVYILLTDQAFVCLVDDLLLPEVTLPVPVGEFSSMEILGLAKIHQVSF